MTETDHECPNCGHHPIERKKEVVNNEVKEKGYYCPDCKTDYSDNTTFEWESLDFPLWIEWESYEDNWGMLRHVERQTGVPEDRIPAGEMKYTVFCVWYKVEEDGTVKGPYDSRGGEKI